MNGRRARIVSVHRPAEGHWGWVPDPPQQGLPPTLTATGLPPAGCTRACRGS